MFEIDRSRVVLNKRILLDISLKHWWLWDLVLQVAEFRYLLSLGEIFVPEVEFKFVNLLFDAGLEISFQSFPFGPTIRREL